MIVAAFEDSVPEAAWSSWRPIELAPVFDGTSPEPEPSILRRSDGRCLLYPGKTHAASGETESLKTWVALIACAQELGAGRSVAFIDFEDSPDSVVVDRLHRSLGVPRDVLEAQFAYIRPDTPLSSRGDRSALFTAAGTRSLVVLDGVTEAMNLHGLDLADNSDVARFLQILARPLAEDGAAVLLLDHVAKASENRGRYGIGAQHKLSGLSGSAYVVERVEPAARGREGHSRLVVAKDRPGRVRQHADRAGVVLDLHLGSGHDGVVRYRLDPPSPGDSTRDGEAWQPTELMTRLSERLVKVDGSITAGALLDTVSGRRAWKFTALRALVDGGYVSETRAGHVVRYVSVKPYGNDSHE